MSEVVQDAAAAVVDNAGADAAAPAQSMPSDSLLADDAPAAPAGLDFSAGKPEGFPDEFWNAEKNAPNVEGLYSKYQEAEARAKGLRDKLAAGKHKAPESADGYKMPALPQAFAGKEEDLAKDPEYIAAKKIAHESGLSQEAFESFVGKYLEFIAETGQQEPAPVELTPEQREEIKKAEYAKIGPNGVQVARNVAGWLKEMESKAIAGKAGFEAIRRYSGDGQLIAELNALRAYYTGNIDVPVGAISDGLPPDGEIADMLAKAYRSNDAAEVRRIEGLMEQRTRAGRPTRLQI